MFLRLSAALVAALPLLDGHAIAKELPKISLVAGNTMPSCATPGRLMAYLRSRNPNVDQRYGQLARLYKKHGEELGIRWDYAFFQMIVETGALRYRRDNGKPSDVRPSQNNFAGLGATGRGEHGESFDDISSGVKAHLQHLKMYAGQIVEAPVAERTRKVQEWGILKSWQKKIGRPITYTDLAAQWAPGSRGYVRDITAVGAVFYETFCTRTDPDPDADRSERVAMVIPDTAATDKPVLPSAAGRRSEVLEEKSSLGAGSLGAADSKAEGDIKIVNPGEATNADAEADPSVEKAPGSPSKRRSARKSEKVAAATSSPLTTAPAKPAASGGKKCRVWTASYGGQKAVLIKSETEQFTNYTVLDVNQGKEQREAEAYIAAYAKGGHKVADFGSQSQALTKAFELCPEG